jgi:hypothetical protein
MEARSVGIVGVGLIGGSIGLAALRAGYRVYLYDCLASEKLAGSKFRPAVIVADLEELALRSRLIILNSDCCARENWCGLGGAGGRRSGGFGCGERQRTGGESSREGLTKPL